MNREHDNLYADPPKGPSPFAFNDQVVQVFDDMIVRSVTGYKAALRLQARIVHSLSPRGTVVDVGCSTGATFLALQELAPVHEMTMIGVDLSQPMIDRATSRLRGAGIEITPVVADVRTYEPPRCDAIVFGYTLQFLPPEDRIPTLRRLASALNPGGVMLISEKLRASGPIAAAMVERHEAFKEASGYTRTEIARKRAALEGVLVPWTGEQNKNALIQSGLRDVEMVHRDGLFATFAGFK